MRQVSVTARARATEAGHLFLALPGEKEPVPELGCEMNGPFIGDHLTTGRAHDEDR
jgi:hypothetical protein